MNFTTFCQNHFHVRVFFYLSNIKLLNVIDVQLNNVNVTINKTKTKTKFIIIGGTEEKS